MPGVRSQPQGTQLGTFGVANGRRTTLTATDADGTRVTFAASRGSGVAYVTPAGRINLTLSDGTGGAAVTIKTAGGADGRVTLGDVTVGGSLRSLTARTANLTGMLVASGSIGRLTLADVAGGTIAAAGAINWACVSTLSDARVMSGAGLGADGKLGGDGPDADSFIAGAIGTLKVLGAVRALDRLRRPRPGGRRSSTTPTTGWSAATESTIRSVVAASADATSRFIAGKVVALKLPTSVDVLVDERREVAGVRPA